MINYITVRISVLLLVILLFLGYNKIIVKAKIEVITLSNKLTKLILIIICLFCWFFPYEKTIIKFKSAEECFSYYYPLGKIYKKFNGDNFSYLYSSVGKTNEFLYYEKTENNWEYIKGKKDVFKSGVDIISINTIPSKDITGIVVSYFDKTGGKLKVSDSMNSQFYNSKQENFSNKEGMFVEKIAFITKKIDSDYTIYIGEKKYKPLKAV